LHSHTADKLAEFLGCSFPCALSGCRSGDNNEVNARFWPAHAAETFTQPAFDPIANHGIANFFAHHETNSGSFCAFVLRPTKRIDDKIASGDPSPAMLHRQK
jgi:hypothetical protein